MNTIVKAPGTAVTTATNPWKQAAQEGRHKTIYGALLKCVKGDWVYGETQTQLRNGTEAVAVVSKAARGWIKWQGGQLVEQRMHEMASGERLPLRETLGDMDQGLWAINAQGKPNDPWQKTYYLPLITKDRTVFTFSTNSKGGESAILELFDAYGEHILFDPGELPVVILGSRKYKHKDRTVGWVAVPTLAVARWVGEQNNIAALAVPMSSGSDLDETEDPGAGMDDEIPF